MQKKDPLGTLVWKLYKKTKAELPNQERMENLTWRMMAMNLKRKEQEQARCVWLRLPLRPLADSAWQIVSTDERCRARAERHRPAARIRERARPHAPRRLHLLLVDRLPRCDYVLARFGRGSRIHLVKRRGHRDTHQVEEMVRSAVGSRFPTRLGALPSAAEAGEGRVRLRAEACEEDEHRRETGE